MATFTGYDCCGNKRTFKFDRLTNAYVEVANKLPDCKEDPLNQYNSIYKKGYNQGVDDYDKGLTPVRIIYNPPATIVFWSDGHKTVVKCSETETFNKYHGFCAALAKRVVGNNSQLIKIVESGFVEGKLPDSCDTRVKPEKKKKSKETKKK